MGISMWLTLARNILRRSMVKVESYTSWHEISLFLHKTEKNNVLSLNT